jgi:hypothetical protein
VLAGGFEVLFGARLYPKPSFQIGREQIKLPRQPALPPPPDKPYLVLSPLSVKNLHNTKHITIARIHYGAAIYADL